MTNETEVTSLSLADIKADPACQARVTTDATTIADYAEIMTEEGNVFPPVVVYYDGADYWLSDGFHRYGAAKKAGSQRSTNTSWRSCWKLGARS